MKALGITAMILAVLGFFVPLITIYWVWMTMVIASISLFTGDEGKSFSIVSWILSIINLLFLSPLFWAAVSGENMGGGSFLAVGTVIFFALPAAAMILRIRNKKQANA